MKKFTRKDLKNKLGYNDDEMKLIMEAQIKFPELLQAECEGFCIDGRKLHEELRVSKAYSTWVKSNLEKVGAIENTDFETCFPLKELENHGGQNKVEYMLTIETAKEIAMVAGATNRANEELKMNSKNIRKYFILMEKAVKNMGSWMVIREPQKEGYKEMSNAIKEQYMETHEGKEPNSFIYTNNADMINLSLFGFKSKQMKVILGVEYSDMLRENLRGEANKVLYELQLLNSSLIMSNIEFQTRKTIIVNTCQKKYLDIRMRVMSEFHKEIQELKTSKAS